MMKKVIIRHLKSDYAVEVRSDDQTFIDSEIARITSKAQLWKSEREIVEFSESYNEADVLSRRSESVGEGIVNYVTLKAEYETIEEDITEAYNAEQHLKQMIADGERAERACKQVKQYVTGYNMNRATTAEQVSSFVATFSTIQLALDANRPNTSKSLIEAVSVDGEVVTQELKDNALAILTRNGF